MSLNDLPDDVILHIIPNLDAKDIIQLNQIKRFRQVFNYYYIIPNKRINTTIDMSNNTDNLSLCKLVNIKLDTEILSMKYKYIEYIPIIFQNRNNIYELCTTTITNKYMHIIADIYALTLSSRDRTLTLPNFTRLDKITLYKCKKLTSNAIQSIKNARVVSIIECPMITDLPKFTRLEELYLEDCISLNNDVLLSVPTVKILKVNYSINNLIVLPKFTQLEHIDIPYVLDDYIDNISNAKIVNIYGGLLSKLPIFTRLEHICIRNCSNLTNIQTISSAKIVDVYNLPIIELPVFIHLEKIKLRSCHNLIMLDKLDAKHVEIADCDSIVNLPEFPNLEEIRIMYVNPNIYDNLDSITHAKKVSIYGRCNSINLPKFTRLDEINIHINDCEFNETINNISNAMIVDLSLCSKLYKLPTFTRLHKLNLKTYRKSDIKLDIKLIRRTYPDAIIIT
jgi:hypothetical protein